MTAYHGVVDDIEATVEDLFAGKEVHDTLIGVTLHVGDRFEFVTRTWVDEDGRVVQVRNGPVLVTRAGRV